MTAKWLSAIALVCLACRVGAGETIDAGNVTVEFERATFSFTSSDGFSPIAISPESVSISPIVDGIDLSFENQMSLSDFSTGESDAQEAVLGNYNAGFSFLPNAGFTISGYRVTLYGTYDIERPGESSATVDGVSSVAFSNGSQQTFSETFETVGAISPQLVGTVSAVGLVDFLEVQVGTEIVQVGTTFEPDPACAEPDPASCPWIEVPLFEERPVYMTQADLGAASINLQGIRLQAVGVPEPTSSVWSLGFVGAMVWRHRLRRRSS